MYLLIHSLIHGTETYPTSRVVSSVLSTGETALNESGLIPPSKAQGLRSLNTLSPAIGKSRGQGHPLCFHGGRLLSSLHILSHLVLTTPGIP